MTSQQRHQIAQQMLSRQMQMGSHNWTREQINQQLLANQQLLQQQQLQYQLQNLHLQPNKGVTNDVLAVASAIGNELTNNQLRQKNCDEVQQHQFQPSNHQKHPLEHQNQPYDVPSRQSEMVDREVPLTEE